MVLDLGANLGEFTQQVYARWGARCISVEANPELCRAWRGPGSAINAAITGVDGETDFHIAANLESSSIYEGDENSLSSSIRIPALSLDTLMRKSGISEADVVKMDVEGAEIEILMQSPDAMLKRLSQITVEFHDFAIPKVTKEDVERVKDRLHAAGFWSVSFSSRDTDVLFINKSAGILSRLEYYWLSHIVRIALGIGRVAGRWLRRSHNVS